ncbi:MAG: LPXTG cell wall anchor domain-containing protein [Micromonosporaceae bacterium]
MYGTLPTTGLNISTPVYLIVGLSMVVAGLVTLALARVRR